MRILKDLGGNLQESEIDSKRVKGGPFEKFPILIEVCILEKLQANSRNGPRLKKLDRSCGMVEKSPNGRVGANEFDKQLKLNPNRNIILC